MENRSNVSKKMVEVARQCMAGDSLEEYTRGLGDATQPVVKSRVKQIYPHPKEVSSGYKKWISLYYKKQKDDTGNMSEREFYASNKDADKRFEELKKANMGYILLRYDNGQSREFRNGEDDFEPFLPGKGRPFRTESASDESLEEANYNVTGDLLQNKQSPLYISPKLTREITSWTPRGHIFEYLKDRLDEIELNMERRVHPEDE
jgi:hypothetical protein